MTRAVWPARVQSSSDLLDRDDEDVDGLPALVLRLVLLAASDEHGIALLPARLGLAFYVE